MIHPNEKWTFICRNKSYSVFFYVKAARWRRESASKGEAISDKVSISEIKEAMFIAECDTTGPIE